MAKNKFNRLAAVMAEHDVDNKMLADGINVNPVTVSLWRTNQQQPTWKRFLQMAEFFKRDVRDFIQPTTYPAGKSKADLAVEAKEKAKAAKKKVARSRKSK